MDELKPCPFCDKSSWEFQILDVEDREGTPCTYVCGECGAAAPWMYLRESGDENSPLDDARLVRRLNGRPIEDALRAEVKELRWSLSELLDAVALPGHVVTHDEWERICLLSGRYCDPYLIAQPDKLYDVVALRAENERLQEELGGLKDGEPCACRWDHGNEKARQMCELHEAWEAAIHDWAARAKIAEAENTALRARAEAAEKKLERVQEWRDVNLVYRCSCSVGYAQRGLIDPSCNWHEFEIADLDAILTDQKGES